MNEKRRKIWIHGFQTYLSVRLALYFVPGLPTVAAMAAVWLLILILPFAVGFWTEGGPAFRLVGIAVRRADGRPASRFRCGVRTALSWVLPLLAGSLNILMLIIKLCAFVWFGMPYRLPSFMATRMTFGR